MAPGFFYFMIIANYYFCAFKFSFTIQLTRRDEQFLHLAGETNLPLSTGRL